MKKEHHGSKWGSTGYRYSGAVVEKLISERPYLQTALDYGCGKGDLGKNFTELDWQEYDPGIPGKQEKPKGIYDLVTCTDVMEHIEHEYLGEVIRELGQYTAKVLFVDIACYRTDKLFAEGPYKGQDMHITTEAPKFWKKLFVQHVGLQLLESVEIEKLSKGKIKQRLQLTYERV